MTDQDPKCEKCGAPVTTGMMAMICPHARQCAFVADDDHWETIEDFRQTFGIKRYAAPGESTKSVQETSGGKNNGC